ncbi:MAG: tetratricopeptide repeat protein, partial [Acidobacteriota bacterium]
EVRPLYIAVAEPRIEGRAGIENSELMAAAVRVALQRSLVSLVGASPINAEALDALDGAPLERARSLGVDELVMSTVDCVPDACHVAVSRVRTADGSVVWTRGLPVPSDDLWLLARAVENHLSQAFPGLERREGFPELKVSGGDYAEYHRLRRASRERRLPPAELLEGVGKLLDRSPDFLEAILFEAFILRERFLTDRDPGDIDLAVDRLAAARRLAPNDPRPLATLFEVQLAASRPEEAQRVLEELEELAPASSAVLVGQARLHELRGQPDLALDAMRRAVRFQPSRPWLHRLAEMEMRTGDMDAVRATLGALLERFPGDEPGLALLAQLELLAGSVERSAEIFERLTAERQDFARLTNLGVARLLLDQPDRAAESFRAALDLAPGNAYARLNLADALVLTGDDDNARRHYTGVIEALDLASSATDWQALTVRAQALAHLGRRQEALYNVAAGLELAPRHPQAVLEASLVRALLGDRDEALELAVRALELGVEPRWLQLPWFEDIRRMPPLSQLLDDGAGGPG